MWVLEGKLFTSTRIDEYKTDLCMVQFYLLPSPPGQPRGQVQPFGPGGGELFEAVLSRGEGAGQIENNCLLFL